MFHFETGRRIFRYKSASIKVSFSSSPPVDDGAHREPIVRNFFPATVFGEKTEANIEWNWMIPVTVGTSSVLPVDVSVKPQIGQKTTFKRGQRMEIRGIAYGYPNPKETNVVQWDLAENKLQKDGVPHLFQCAAIVLHDHEDFTADVTVKFATAMSVGSIDPRAWMMAGRPWTKDDPIMFKRDVVTEGISTLPELLNVDLSKLTDKQCQSLTPLPKEDEVRPIPSNADYIGAFDASKTILIRAIHSHCFHGS